jgi:hypothetical protein
MRLSVVGRQDAGHAAAGETACMVGRRDGRAHMQGGEAFLFASALLKLVRLCYSSALARERDGVPR